MHRMLALFRLFSYRGLDKLPLCRWTNAALISGINHLTTDGLVLPLAYKYIYIVLNISWTGLFFNTPRNTECPIKEKRLCLIKLEKQGSKHIVVGSSLAFLMTYFAWLWYFMWLKTFENCQVTVLFILLSY